MLLRNFTISWMKTNSLMQQKRKLINLIFMVIIFNSFNSDINQKVVQFLSEQLLCEYQPKYNKAQISSKYNN